MPLSKRCSFFWSSILMLAMEAKAFTVTPYLNQSFLFDWNLPGQPVPIPTTAQCETINITWGRQAATGPNPVAPYYFEIYTSTATVPLVLPAGPGLFFPLTIPFSPGTLYQICMFDSMGNTGGCQATYTVIPPLSTPNCSNFIFPPPLDVQGTVDTGPLSEYGWIDQCTDISILPKNGTPPYTLTIAPALHPPYNITSNDMSSLNWTISLSYASSFFIGLYDSAGNMWSNGPLHSGGGGTTACLAGNATMQPALVQPAIAIGAGVGGLVAGLLIGLAVAFLLIRQYYEKKIRADRFVDLPSTRASPSGNVTSYANYRAVPTATASGVRHPAHLSISSSTGLNRSGSMQYHVEPFVMPDENGRFDNEARSILTETTPPEPAAGPQQLYVLHHDSNIAPVTILHGTGTEIVELPPRYANTSQSDEAQSRTDTRSDASRAEGSQPLRIHEPRQPAQVGKSARSP